MRGNNISGPLEIGVGAGVRYRERHSAGFGKAEASEVVSKAVLEIWGVSGMNRDLECVYR